MMNHCIIVFLDLIEAVTFSYQNEPLSCLLYMYPLPTGFRVINSFRVVFFTKIPLRSFLSFWVEHEKNYNLVMDAFQIASLFAPPPPPPPPHFLLRNIFMLFCCLMIFLKVKKNSFRNTIWVSKSLDPVQTQTRPAKLLGLVWVESVNVNLGYQQAILEDKELTHVRGLSQNVVDFLYNKKTI